MPTPCAECHEPTPEHLLFRERIEYVNADITKRVHVQTLRLLCRTCVDEVWERAEPPVITRQAWAPRKVVGAEQPELFG
jgi:hypothetical protein